MSLGRMSGLPLRVLDSVCPFLTRLLRRLRRFRWLGDDGELMVDKSFIFGVISAFVSASVAIGLTYAGLQARALFRHTFGEVC